VAGVAMIGLLVDWWWRSVLRHRRPLHREFAGPSYSSPAMRSHQPAVASNFINQRCGRRVAQGNPYSPLNAGACDRSAQSEIELGRPISDGIGFPSVFFLSFLIYNWFFIWFCWFFSSSFFILRLVFLNFQKFDFFEFERFLSFNIFRFDFFKICIIFKFEQFSDIIFS
jgi:hypothetical protein